MTEWVANNEMERVHKEVITMGIIPELCMEELSKIMKRLSQDNWFRVQYWAADPPESAAYCTACSWCHVVHWSYVVNLNCVFA
jgi:hypothetical protein